LQYFNVAEFPVLTARYSKHLKKVTLQRYIVSKLYYAKQSDIKTKRITVRHIVVLYDNLLYLQDMALRNPSFHEKFGYSLLRITKILKKLKISKMTDLKTIILRLRAMIRQDKRLSDDFVYPERNISSIGVKVEHLFDVKSSLTPLGKKKSTLKQKQILGKGYTDKGTSRKPHLDGSPSWQEIASDKRINPPESYYVDDKEQTSE